MDERTEGLIAYIAGLKGGVCVAFSAGVDSTLVLAAAVAAGVRVHAVTFHTRLHPPADLLLAKELANGFGVRHSIIEMDEFSDPEILKNPVNRCYLCKRLLFSSLLSYAAANELVHVLDGTNAGDLLVYRPGIRALRELGVISPLAALGITKKEVRRMATALGVATANRPSAPCLATRLPYGTAITSELLERIGQGEEILHNAGFEEVRLRVHGEIVRIEVPAGRFQELLAQRVEITNALQRLGFGYITLDLEGFRSGSMDIHLTPCISL